MRVKLAIPDSTPLYESSYTLGVADMNYGNHLGNDRVLTLAHEARLRYLKSLNYDELNFFKSALIMSDAMVQYKGQGFMGDEITLKVWIENVSEIGFDFFTHIHHQNDPKKEIARVKCAMLFFNYEENKRQRAPQEFCDQFLKE